MPTPGHSLPILYTIGHSVHAFPEFAAILKQHGVAVVADVRSQPASRWRPHFGRGPLARLLAEEGVSYLFLGRELGARRDEPQAYEGSRASYELIARLPLFQQGLARVREEAGKRSLALMCAEKDPLTCHRSVLICRHLREAFDIRHIHADGRIETHAVLEDRMMRAIEQEGATLLASPRELLANAYRVQGGRMGYTRKDEPRKQ